MEKMDFIFLALGVLNMLAGIASLWSGKVHLMGSSASKYTDESLKKYARPLGVMNLFAGLGLIASSLLKDELFNLGFYSVKNGMVILVGALLISLTVYVASRKILVKK